MMSRYSETCLDSNVLVRSVEEQPRPEIKELWREWMRDRVVLHAPTLLRYEATNAIHRMWRAGQLGSVAASRAMASAMKRPIVLHQDDELHLKALNMAATYDLPAAHDAHYLALAARLGVELWTTDARLVKAVEDRLTWVRLVS